MRVEVYLTTAMEVSHFAPVVRALRSLEVDAVFISPQQHPKAKARGWDDADRTELLLKRLDLPFEKYSDIYADAVLTIQPEGFVDHYRKLKIRMTYGVGLIPPTNSSSPGKPFDFHLVHGPFNQRVQFQYHALPSPSLPPERVKVIGYPRFDDWWNGKKDCTCNPKWIMHWPDCPKYIQPDYGVGIKKPPVLLWLPTWGAASSIARFADAIFALSDKYDIWVKPHHGTVTWERERMARLADGPCRIVDFDEQPEPSFAAASIVLADLASGAFSEAVFLRKRLIGLSSFSEIANLLVPINHSIPIACTPDHIGSAIGTSELTASRRTEIRSELVDSTEGADGMRAAKIIVECVEGTIDNRAKNAHG